MSRTVPTALQTHLNLTATTTARLLKIMATNGMIFGLTTLDQDVTYDDDSGDGEIVYRATNGFDPSTFSADSGFSVANAEARTLVAGAIDGVTSQMIAAGDLDDAEWVCYLVNFMDLSMGHVILDAGDVGEVTTIHDMLWIPELLSYVARLKQPIGAVDSLTCRAIYGTPADSHTGCGIDVTSLWVSGTVQSVGAETDRTFTGDFLATLISSSYPGRIQFLTGDNAGREYSTETVVGLIVSLGETTPYPISAGDTYRHRRDCRKEFIADCITLNANGENFKGEPHIPVGTPVQTENAQKSKKHQVFGSLG